MFLNWWPDPRSHVSAPHDTHKAGRPMASPTIGSILMFCTEPLSVPTSCHVSLIVANRKLPDGGAPTLRTRQAKRTASLGLRTSLLRRTSCRLVLRPERIACQQTPRYRPYCCPSGATVRQWRANTLLGLRSLASSDSSPQHAKGPRRTLARAVYGLSRLRQFPPSQSPPISDVSSESLVWPVRSHSFSLRSISSCSSLDFSRR